MVASVVVITGTPGTGKTSLGEKLRTNGYEVINLQEFAIENDCNIGFDTERNSIIIDEDKLYEVLIDFLEIKDGIIIIEGHYGDIIPEHFVTHCFVLTAELKDLKTRLKQREYSDKKIKENLQAEIMKECWITALDSFGEDRVFEISPMSQEEVFDLIINKMS